MNSGSKNGDRWQDSGFLFVKSDGAPIHADSFAGWLRKFTKRHDLPHLHPHGFRHTNASMLIGNGVDVVTVANRLGHSDVSTTLDIYSHAINEAKAKASETLADVMLRRKKRHEKTVDKQLSTVICVRSCVKCAVKQIPRI